MQTVLSKSKYLTNSERLTLEESLEKYTAGDFRNAVFLKLMLYTGARVSEVLAIRRKDLFFDGPSIHIQASKGSLDRDLPLSKELYKNLLVLADGLAPDERIFKFGYDNARLIWNHWRPVNKRIHSLRHTRAMEIYQKSKDVRLVQKFLGHKSLSSTLVYTEYDYTAREFRKFTE